MALDRATADLGWKSNDEPKHGRAHRLATNDSDDIDRAFRTLINTKNQPRRRREVFMEIIHLVCFGLIKLQTDSSLTMFIEPCSH